MNEIVIIVIFGILCAVIIYALHLIFHNKNHLFGLTPDTTCMSNVKHIYWINLDRSLDRRLKMDNLFKENIFDGIVNIRVKAIDDIEAKNKIVNKNSNYSWKEYACCMSHIKAIKMAIDAMKHNSEPYTLIMEDDLTLELQKYWKYSISEIVKSAPHDWEILLLSCIYPDDKNIKDSCVFEKYTHNSYYGSAAYLIKNTDMLETKIHEVERHLYKNVNICSDSLLYNIFNTYNFKYSMFIYGWNECSTIHQNHVSVIHDPSKVKIINMYETTTLPDTLS